MHAAQARQPSLLTLSPSQLSTHTRPRHGVSFSHTERKNTAWVLPRLMSEHHGLLFNTDQCSSGEAASHSVPGHSPVQTGSVAEVEQQLSQRSLVGPWETPSSKLLKSRGNN